MAQQNKQSTEAAVRDIRRQTRRKFSREEKNRIALEGLRGEPSVSDLCRREGIASNLYLSAAVAGLGERVLGRHT
jgi:transposase